MEKKDMKNIISFKKKEKNLEAANVLNYQNGQPVVTPPELKPEDDFIAAPNMNKLAPEMTLEVENKEAQGLIDDFNEQKTNESLTALINYMVTRRVLVPAGMDDKKRILPMTLTDPEGKIIQPVMTDKSFIPEKPRPEGILNLRFLEIVDIVLKQENIHGIGINIFGKGIILTRALLLQVQNHEQAKARAMAQRSQPADPNTPVINVPGAKDMELIKNPDGTITQKFSISAEDYFPFERVRFEANFLPNAVMERGQELIDRLCEERETYLDELFEESYTNKRMYPYLPEEFKVVPMNVSEEQEIIQITMPKQHLKGGLAESLFIVWNGKEKTCRYFALVRGDGIKRNAMEIPFANRKAAAPVILGEAPVEGMEISWVADICEK